MSNNQTRLKPGSNGCNWQPQTLPEVYSCKAMMGLINTITAATIQSLKMWSHPKQVAARLLHACCTLNVKLFGGPSRHATIIYEILPMRTHMYQMMILEARRGPWLSFCISFSVAGLKWGRSTGKTLLHLPCLSHHIMRYWYIFSSCWPNMWNLNLKEHSILCM